MNDLKKRTFLTNTPKLINTNISRVIQPIILVHVLKYFDRNSTMSKTEAYLWSTALVLANILTCFAIHMSMYLMAVMSMRIRVASCALVYEKILNISKAVMESNSSAGQVSTDFSNTPYRDYYTQFKNYIKITVTDMNLLQ